MVYGVLGLSFRPGEENFDSRWGCEITVDYRASVTEVYRSVARKLLIDCSYNGVLAVAGPYNSNSELSSWVPDWRKNHKGRNFAIASRIRGYSISGDLPVDIRAVDDVSKIAVAGRSIAILNSVSSMRPWDYDPGRQLGSR
jgi:hypothetical protein